MRRAKIWALLGSCSAALAVLAAAGCPGDNGTQPGTPDYTLTLAPAALTIEQGSTGNATVTLTRTNFSAAVTLSVENAPAGVIAVFAPVAPTGTSSSLAVTVLATVPPGTYNLTVNGTGTPGNRSTPLTLTVTATPNFVLSVAPASLTITQGASDNTTVTITRTIVTDAVTLSVGNAPTGVTSAFAPATTTGTSSTLTITVGAAVIPGTYTVAVHGTGTLGIRSTSLTLIVTPAPDYALSVAPTALTIPPGASANATVTIARTNFAGAVTLSLGNAPAGVTGVFGPPAPTIATSTLTLTVEVSVTPGVYALAVNGSGTPGNRSTELILTVGLAGDYALSLAPAALTIVPGTSRTSDVTITRANFTGAVTLSLVGPAGVTGVFVPAAPTGTTSVLTVSVAAGVAPGSYNLSVNGTGTPGSRSTPLDLTVPNPCNVLVALPPDTTVNAVLTNADCQFNGPFFTDFYSVALPSQAGLQVSMNASFDTYVEQYHVSGPFIAVSDDVDSTNTNSRLNIIAAPGTYRLAASTFDANVTGSYTVTVAPRPQTLTGCRGEIFLPWITRGVTVADQIQATDCSTTRGGGGVAYSDRVLITLSPTSPLTVTLTSGAFNPRLELYLESQTGPTLVASANGVGGVATLTHASADLAVFRLEITSVGTTETGAYTLNVGGTAPTGANVTVLPIGPSRLRGADAPARTKPRPN